MESKKTTVIPLRGHHLDLLHFFLMDDDAEKQLKVSLAEYGEVHANNTINILKTITTSPADTNIKLVDGIDNICETCKDRCRYNREEQYGTGIADRLTIRYYGLEPGKVYPAAKIRNILQLFKKGNPIRLRGAHLRLLSLFLQDEIGYKKRAQLAEDFGEKHLNNTARIFKKIRAQKIKNVQITDIMMDDICKTCKERPYFYGNNCADGWRLCVFQNQILGGEYKMVFEEDKEMIGLLKLKKGKIYPARVILERLKDCETKVKDI